MPLMVTVMAMVTDTVMTKNKKKGSFLYLFDK